MKKGDIILISTQVLGETDNQTVKVKAVYSKTNKVKVEILKSEKGQRGGYMMDRDALEAIRVDGKSSDYPNVPSYYSDNEKADLQGAYADANQRANDLINKLKTTIDAHVVKAQDKLNYGYVGDLNQTIKELENMMLIYGEVKDEKEGETK